MSLKVITLAVLVCAFEVHAEVDLRPDKERDSQQTINVEVPKSQIALEPLRYQQPLPTEFSISASSWVPTNFSRDTYANGRTGFSGDGTPAFQIARISQFANLGSGVMLADKFGLGYLGLTRHSSLTVAGSPTNSTSENINLFMAQIGLELQFEHLLGGGFVPNIGLSAMPTYALAERSAFEDNVGVFGVPLEATVGVLWHSHFGIGGGSAFGVGVAGQYVSGSVDGSSMNGLGVLGELRLTL